ncbi:SAM domain-containing protein [Aphelenchoides fujianensis]|nr:SAM domain-containing protein [Aphelenchoides fujianensis]
MWTAEVAPIGRFSLVVREFHFVFSEEAVGSAALSIEAARMSGGINKGPNWLSDPDWGKMNLLNRCRSGELPEVREILRQGDVDVDEGDDDGMTALQIASACGHLNLVEELVGLGATVDLANQLGYTPFLHACREGHLHVVKFLKQHGADEKRKTGFGMSALGLASAGGHVEVMRFLSSLEVDMIPTEEGLTPSPLMAAAARSHVHAVQFLASRHVPPLGFSSFFPFSGGNVNYSSRGLGLTPLHLAVICGNAEVIDALVRLKAPLEKLSFKNKKAEKIALYAENKEAQRYIELFKRSKRIPEKPPKIHVCPFFPSPSSIQFARVAADIVMKGDPEALHKLRRQYSTLTVAEITPLMYAVVLGKLEAIQHLCEADLDANQLTATSLYTPSKLPANSIATFVNLREPKLGMTALMMAVVVRDFEMVFQLVQAGADPNVEARFKDRPFTAFDLAFNSGFSAALQLMLFNENCSGGEKKHFFNRSGGREQQKSSPKELLNRLMQRLGIVDEEKDDEISGRATFDSLVQPSLTDWSQPLPFFTADQLMQPGCVLPRPLQPPTADDRVGMVRNMAKSLVQHPGFLKPFPVGVPVDGDYQRFYQFFSSFNSFSYPEHSTDRPDGEREDGSIHDAMHNYTRMKRVNSSRESGLQRTPSDFCERSGSSHSGILASNSAGAALYAADSRNSLLQLRTEPTRRKSENTHKQHRVSAQQRFSNSNDAPSLSYSQAATSFVESNESIRSTRTNGLYAGSCGNAGALGIGQRHSTLYAAHSAASMPATPALNPPPHRRFTMNSANSAPGPSPNSSTKLRHRVPHGHRAHFHLDPPPPLITTSASAPATPPANASAPPLMIVPPTPRVRKSSVLTMEKIRSFMDAAGVAAFFPHFVQQEIDPTVFLKLSKEEVRTIVGDPTATEKIHALIGRLNQTYGSGSFDRI